MITHRLHGVSPYQIAVLHGGPGAAGSAKVLCQILAQEKGVLEPFQTQDSVTGQIEELRRTLDQHANLPVTLIGHSWGAMLAYLFTAAYPHYVQKLILIGSGVFEAHYAQNIMALRLSRMSEEKKFRLHQLMEQVETEVENADELFYQAGNLIEEADTFDPLTPPHNECLLPDQYHIFKTVWPEAAHLRKQDDFLKRGKNIQCPVIAIHGDYDPHPYQGVQEPLSRAIQDFNFILLEKCGHEPWNERQASDHFFKVLRAHL